MVKYQPHTRAPVPRVVRQETIGQEKTCTVTSAEALLRGPLDELFHMGRHVKFGIQNDARNQVHRCLIQPVDPWTDILQQLSPYLKGDLIRSRCFLWIVPEDGMSNLLGRDLGKLVSRAGLEVHVTLFSVPDSDWLLALEVLGRRLP